MKAETLIYGLAGLVIGLIIGFSVANALNRSFPAQTVNRNITLPETAPSTTNREASLSREEIAAAFASAEIKKDDFTFQKNLGIALTGYAKSQNESDYLPQLAKLLERVNTLSKEKDFDVLMALGDVYFLESQQSGDSNALRKARSAYERAEQLKPEQVDAEIALAATFLFSSSPQPEIAITILNRVSTQNPNHEIALQLLISALIKNGKFDLAEQKLTELKRNNPDNPAIPDLAAQIKQKQILY